MTLDSFLIDYSVGENEVNACGTISPLKAYPAEGLTGDYSSVYDMRLISD